MTKIHCGIYHETDGACCDENERCPIAAARTPVMRANANLSLWHMAGFAVAMISIYGWGLYTLDRALARDTATLEASR